MAKYQLKDIESNGCRLPFVISRNENFPNNEFTDLATGEKITLPEDKLAEFYSLVPNRMNEDRQTIPLSQPEVLKISSKENIISE